MKLNKILVTAMALGASMFALTGCAAAGDASGAATTGSMLGAMLPFIIILVVMYVMMVIPENKRKKKAQEMRNSIEVGDKIVTIGGMVGKVVHVGPDRITFETGEDRVRIEINKWAVSSNEGRGAAKETTSSEETLSN